MIVVFACSSRSSRRRSANLVHAFFRTAGLTFRLVMIMLAMLAMTNTAYAQSEQATIESPADAFTTGIARTVRIRWPETTLSPLAAGKLVSVDNVHGKALPFTFLIAAEDQGHTLHPMWLVIRFDGAPPYRLSVGKDVHGTFVDDLRAVGAASGATLGSLPMAMIRADAWGPITAMLEDAQNTQQSSNASWQRWILLAAFALVLLLTSIIAMFMRHQARREDVGKL